MAETRNEDLYKRVREIRRMSGIKEKYCSADPVPHPMVGRQFIRKSGGKVYNVEKAVRHWYWGWYYALLLENNGSHLLIIWENISSEDILPEIELTRKEWNVVPLPRFQ